MLFILRVPTRFLVSMPIIYVIEVPQSRGILSETVGKKKTFSGLVNVVEVFINLVGFAVSRWFAKLNRLQ